MSFANMALELAYIVLQACLSMYFCNANHNPNTTMPPPTAMPLITSMDSNLEAFNHNPTDGGIEAWTCQTATFTTYLNEVFLSY